MIDRKEIERLGRMLAAKGVVSVSVKIDPQLGYERGQPAMKFKGAYARAKRGAGASDLAVLEREHDRILDFLKDYAPRGRGVIIYSSTPDDIWEVHPLETEGTDAHVALFVVDEIAGVVGFVGIGPHAFGQGDDDVSSFGFGFFQLRAGRVSGVR